MRRCLAVTALAAVLAPSTAEARVVPAKRQERAAMIGLANSAIRGGPR